MGTKKSPSPNTLSPRTPARTARSARKPRKPPRSQHPVPSSERTSPKTPRIKRRVSDFATKKPSAKKRKRDTPQPDQDVDELLRDIPQLIKAENSHQATELRNALKRARQTFHHDESGSDSSFDNADQPTLPQSDALHGNSIKHEKRLEKRVEGSAKRKNGPMPTPSKDVQQEGRKARHTSEILVTPPKPPLPQNRKLDLSAKRARLRESGGNKARRMSVTASAHKRDIEALKQDDPDFYKFLQQHDASLLDFDLDDELLFSGEEDGDGENSGNDGSEEKEEEEEEEEREEEIEDMVTEKVYGTNGQQRVSKNPACLSAFINTSTQVGDPRQQKISRTGDHVPEKLGESGSESDDSDTSEQEVEPLKSEPVDAKTREKNVAPWNSAHSHDSSGSEGEGDEENKERKKDTGEGEEEVQREERKEAADKEIADSEAGKELSDHASGSNNSPEETATGEDENLSITDSDRHDAEVTEPNSDSDGSSQPRVLNDNEDDDDDERREEMLAAAEAGLALDDDEMDVDSTDDFEPADDDAPVERRKKRTVIVDTAFLRSLKEALSRKRTCLKATKDLLRMLRAGREILPSQADTPDKKAKMNKKKSQGRYSSSKQSEDPADIEKDEFADDGSFTSGNVKFVSSKAYQNGMNLAIVGIQDALDLMLGRPQSKKGPPSETQLLKWDPTSNVRWPNLQPLFRPYVFHMLALCNNVNDADTLRFLLKRLERLVPYTRENELLLKKIIRIAVRIWSSESQHMSEATRLRAYILLNRIAHGRGNTEAVLRSCCAVFVSDIAVTCNSKTLSRIHFAITCIVELFGIDMGASYTTAFANLRELAVSLRAVLVSKEESTEIERIHNWSYVNQLRLWSKVLSRYGSEDELRPLIYPYVQVALGVMRVHATPRTFPMRLHIASFLSDVVACTGIFIPLTPHLLLLLKCSELRKKPERGKTKALEWRSMLRVSADVIKTKPFLSGVINGVVLELAKFFATISKHVSFPELSYNAQSILRKFSKEVLVSEWKAKVLMLVEKLYQTSELIEKARAKADFAPHGAVSPEGMLAVVPGLDQDMKTPIQRFYEVETRRVRKEEGMRDEQNSDDKGGLGARDPVIATAKVRFAEQSAQTGPRGTSSAISESDASDSDSDSNRSDLGEGLAERKKGHLGGGQKERGKATIPSLSVPKMVDEDDENDMVEDLVIDSQSSSDDE